MTLFASAQYTLLLLLHTLLLVYWLGLDLGIFYLGACLGRRELPAFTRTTLCQILITLDMVPRFCLVLMLPVGTQLALTGGYTTLPDSYAWRWPIIGFVWLFSLAWVALIARGFRDPDSFEIPRADRVLRLIAIAALVIATGSSALGFGPVDKGAGWLMTKLLIYAAIVGADMMIHSAFRPLRMAFSAMGKGAIPVETETTIRTALSDAKPWVLASWAGLVIEAWLGLAKFY
jgi:hypothetical protein